jgi:inosine-uridine nucleoside N-ribohydrolase
MIRFLLATLLLAVPSFSAAPPPHVIFDTDIGNDIDDALALAMLHAMESRGECKLIGVTITKDHPNAAKYVDIVNTFYGRGTIPIGVVKNGKTPEDSPMLRVPVAHKPPYPAANRPPEEAVELLQRLLKKEKDGSVVIVQVGFFTNLARLLDAPGASQLIRRKVRLLSVMAGAFPSGNPEYNVMIDIPSSQKVFAEWPTPIVASGYEIGLAVLYPAHAIMNYFKYAENHPVVDAYRAYKKMPYDRPTWDLTAVLYAVRPRGGFFTLSERGAISVDAKGKTEWTPDPKGNHRYLILDPSMRKSVLDALVQLSSRPPDRLAGVPNHQERPEH